VAQLTEQEALLAYFAFLINRRNEEGMTQEEIAEKVGTSTATISDIKNRKQTGLRLGTAIQMARFLANKSLAEVLKIAADWAKDPNEPSSLTDKKATKDGKEILERVRADRTSVEPKEKDKTKGRK
jgi:transcriptional regulator with XRE-family HTH domain